MKLKRLIENIFSIKNEYTQNKKFKVVKILGIKIKRNINKNICPSIYNKQLIPNEGIIYKENKELGLANIDIKLERYEQGGPFEYEDMIIANKSIGDNFLSGVRNVVNIGSGVATFEWYNAKNYPDTNFIASEFDEKSTNWAIKNRSLPNVTYCTDDIETLLNKYGKFDLAISVDVIEHIKDYKSFLDEFVKLSDKAVIATPNRDRYNDLNSLISPPYQWHTHEFNAGEFYFILKMYYKDVTLYSLENPLDTELKQVGIYSTYEKLIAYCEK